MIIITYSETNAETIEQRLGKAEYSYYFIYKKYLPAMERIGRLVSVNDPLTEVDRIYRENPDEDCIFLSFSPPHRTVLDLECPTVCVFAWEFSTIPAEAWHDTPEYNWAAMLGRIGNALTISQYAADVVEKAVPEGLNLVVLPAAVDTAHGTALKPKTTAARSIEVKATLYDSKSYNLSTDMVNDEVRGSRDPLKMQPWDDQPIELSFTEKDADSIELLIGFYSSEEWGTWSRTMAPWIMLPHNVCGPVVIELEIVAYGTNIGREISIQLGSEESLITPDETPRQFRLEFNPQSDADLLKFSNLDLTHAPGARDHRSLGIGVKSMKLQRPPGYRKPGSSFVSRLWQRFKPRTQTGEIDDSTPGNTLELNGVVYTTVMNPQDGRKNWEDMVTAFCWAFRDEENATLVLKMTHHNLTTFLGKLLLLYSQMSPFKCRVVAVHGFLTEEQYDALIDSTHYVVNSSHCEGQCLPLMEFMGQGIPAVAPDHTAMADYISGDNAFVVASSLYPTFWPIDERKSIRTLCYRLDWNSLKDRYLESFRVAMEDEKTYEAMRNASIEAVETAAGQDTVYRRMQGFVDTTARRAGG